MLDEVIGGWDRNHALAGIRFQRAFYRDLAATEDRESRPARVGLIDQLK